MRAVCNRTKYASSREENTTPPPVDASSAGGDRAERGDVATKEEEAAEVLTCARGAGANICPAVVVDGKAGRAATQEMQVEEADDGRGTVCPVAVRIAVGHSIAVVLAGVGAGVSRTAMEVPECTREDDRRLLLPLPPAPPSLRTPRAPGRIAGADAVGGAGQRKRLGKPSCVATAFAIIFSALLKKTDEAPTL